MFEKELVGIVGPIILYGSEAWCMKKTEWEFYGQ